MVTRTARIALAILSIPLLPIGFLAAALLNRWDKPLFDLEHDR